MNSLLDSFAPKVLYSFTDRSNMDIEGTICPMPTPTVDSQPDIDTDALERYTGFLVEHGVHGLFPCGSIGEFSSLTAAQRETVIETVARTTEDASVLAGCGDTSVTAVLDHASAAADAGADAAVVVTPYYLSTTQSGLRRFVEAVADSAPLPVVLYNIPALTGEALSRDLVVDLADHENVVGIKDTSGDLTYLYDVIERTPADFSVLQGATQLSAASLDAGADGMVAGPANVFPEHLSAMFEAARRDDAEQVQNVMQSVVHPVVSATADVPTAPAVKHLVSLRGYDIGNALAPLPELTDDARARLTACFEQISEFEN